MTLTLEITSLILSIVALIVTVLGFFASLKFYRDGVQMSSAAQDALTKIEQKTDAINSQVGGMFDKTLNAALGIKSPSEVARLQEELQNPSPQGDGGVSVYGDPDHKHAAPVGEPAALPTQNASQHELALIDRYFLFKKLQLTDVTNPDNRALFLLGNAAGFNLFHGSSSIVFFGFFKNFESTDIVFRIRRLLTNIQIAYTNIQENLPPATAERAREILGRIAIVIWIPDDLKTAALNEKIMEFQSSPQEVELSLLTTADFEREVKEEFARMSI